MVVKVMVSGRDTRCLIICLLTVNYILYSDSCEPWEVKRNNHCCIPVFNCQPGYEVTECPVDGKQETCTKCAEGTVQPDWINSFSAQRSCFKIKQACPAFDLAPTDEGRNKCVPQYCKCNRNRCFYENTCVCYRADPCGVNETLNTATGGCVPCGPYEYKDVSGCGPCLVNVTEWMTSKGNLDIQTELPIYSTVTKYPQTEELQISSTTKIPSPQNSQTDRGIYFTLTIAFIVVSVVISVISVLVCIILCRRIKQLQRSHNKRQQSYGEDIPLQNHQVYQENRT